MSEIETYINSSLQLIDGIVHGHDSDKLFDEFGIISTNPNDPEENGAASIVLTYGGPLCISLLGILLISTTALVRKRTMKHSQMIL